MSANNFYAISHVFVLVLNEKKKNLMRDGGNLTFRGKNIESLSGKVIEGDEKTLLTFF